MAEDVGSEDVNTRSTVIPIAPPQRPAPEDVELAAINEMVKALSPLNPEQLLRALEYVNRRFNMTSDPPVPHLTLSPEQRAPSPAPEGQSVIPLSKSQALVQDIRTLKEAKKPKSAIEMAALVGYYVSEVAPEPDRKKDIGKQDIERHFKAAGFKLPSDASFTLVNAKNAGYLDSAGGGQYKLNPVGYNLVVHRMQNRNDDTKKPERGRKPRAKVRTIAVKKVPRAKK